MDATLITLSPKIETLYATRAEHSRTKLRVLRKGLSNAKNVQMFDKFTIFAAGSYGRLEASEHSDIDLFFLLNKNREELSDFRVPEIRMLSDVITIGDNMDFPKFSNDGEFLSILFANDLIDKIGGRYEDATNHFTARMLMILESQPVFGEKVYNSILLEIIKSYFRDYEHHPNDFRPTFLSNDILRFWRTLCLNYEHRRNQAEERKKIGQKIKNFKLGFSRLMTCYAMIAALACHRETISPEDVLKISNTTPADRLREISAENSSFRTKIDEILTLYGWFIEKTGNSTEELESYFSQKANRVEAFGKADEFGKSFFELVYAISSANENLRYLVI